MNNPILTKRVLVFTLFFSLFILVTLFFFELIDTRNRVVFCNVGQGDGAYIRLNGDTDILIDVGPQNNKILSCLGAHMPFFDRTVEYVIISHPQADHDGGLPEILRRYTVNQVLFSAEFRTYPSVIRFEKSAQKTAFVYVQDGQVLDFSNGLKLYFITTEQNNIPLNENDKSLTVLLKTKSYRFLFTGDISSAILSKIQLSPSGLPLVLEVPHHGSRYGLSESFLQRERPEIAVISVGKNGYGHPALHTLDLLNRYHVSTMRTDKEGEIVFEE